MPNIVTGVLARVLLATFADMRDWRVMPDMDTEKQKALTRRRREATLE